MERKPIVAYRKPIFKKDTKVVLSLEKFQGKTVCPLCLDYRYLVFKTYGIDEKRDCIYFSYFCEKCNVNLESILI